MKKYSIVLKTGTRKSKLALIQSDNSCRFIEDLFPFLKFELIKYYTPGDRDKVTDLKTSSDDFFSKDLDESVLNNQIDCAIHSAKDLSYPVKDGLDWFWLPQREDPRDIIICSAPISKDNPVIGVSSERREKYALERWPNAELKPIRGNIEERIKQLDDGGYDVLIMAAAALNRLTLQHRISEYISLDDLPPPEGQGYIAVTFKKNNVIFNNIRKYFIKSVTFAGAGPGNPDLVTIGTLKALRNCTICLYDSLISIKLLEYLPKTAKAVFVGKRCGAHSIKQNQITQLIGDYSRQGHKVVRLKGGDPGIFGRLTEETEILNELELPYRVIPGISSINCATSATGLLLTRRDIARGFSVATCRQKNSKHFVPINKNELNEFTKIFLMSISFIPELTEHLIRTGLTKETPVSVVFNAGCVDEKIICSGLGKIVSDLKNIDKTRPGIIIVGKNSEKKYLFKNNGALSSQRILLTCSENIIEKAAERVLDYGGIPLLFSMIKLQPNLDIIPLLSTTIHSYDWLIITSPGSVYSLINILSKNYIDIRNIPKIIVCGKGTSDELKKYHIIADAVAENDFGSKGLLNIVERFVPHTSKILRLRSNLASKTITDTLLKKGYDINEIELYETINIKHDSIPFFDSVVFASSSAVHGFVKNFGIKKLMNKTAVVFGKPTEKALLSYTTNCTVIVNSSSTIKACIDLLSRQRIENCINTIYL